MFGDEFAEKSTVRSGYIDGIHHVCVLVLAIESPWSRRTPNGTLPQTPALDHFLHMKELLISAPSATMALNNKTNTATSNAIDELKYIIDPFEPHSSAPLQTLRNQFEKPPMNVAPPFPKKLNSGLALSNQERAFHSTDITR